MSIYSEICNNAVYLNDDAKRGKTNLKFKVIF